MAGEAQPIKGLLMSVSLHLRMHNGEQIYGILLVVFVRLSERLHHHRRPISLQTIPEKHYVKHA
jgi:hypothetical protein